MLPVSLMNDHNREVFILVDRHNDHVADFNWARDDHECQRIVELINTNDAALRRAKAEVWREAATHVLTCMHAVDAANDFDARAAQIEADHD